MMHLMSRRTLKTALRSTLAAVLCATLASGCLGIDLPPLPLVLQVATDVQIVAANETDGTVEILLPVVFCDLFSEEELDALLREAGGDALTGLFSISAVDLENVVIEATGPTAGDFSGFTSANLRLVGATTLPLGAAEDNGGLGTNFELTQNDPVDLINDIPDGECGALTLTLLGAAAPTEDITFTATANVLVYTRLGV